MPGTVFIEGENVNLRTIEEEDIEFLREGINHPDVRKYLSVSRPKNYEDEREFFEEVISKDDSVDLLITREGERLGTVGLYMKGDGPERLAEIGIWLHPDYHGKGAGTEASELLIDHGFNHLRLHKVLARVKGENTASHRIWEKLGFEKEGVLREHTFLDGEYKDATYYGILEGEWK